MQPTAASTGKSAIPGSISVSVRSWRLGASRSLAKRPTADNARRRWPDRYFVTADRRLDLKWPARPQPGRAKKAPRKAHVPGGQRTLLPFRERLDAITLACGRTHMQSALGGRKRLPHVGECIVADGWLPCQHQPLRGLTVPSRGAGPSTWIVGLRSERRCQPARVVGETSIAVVQDAATTTCPAGPSFIPSSWGGRIRQASDRVKVDFSTK